MKNVWIIAVIGVMCFMAGTLTRAAKTPTSDEALVAAEVSKMFKVTSTATKLDAAALKEVTDATMYDVKVKIAGPGGGSSRSSLIAVKQGKTVTTLSRPSTSQDCPGLKTMLKKTFKLKSDANAKALEAVLDALYPISDRFGGKDKKAKAIKREGAKFIFVRGEFFKNLKGFIFETDSSGSVVKVTYSLRIKRGGASAK